MFKRYSVKCVENMVTCRYYKIYFGKSSRFIVIDRLWQIKPSLDEKSPFHCARTVTWLRITCQELPRLRFRDSRKSHDILHVTRMKSGKREIGKNYYFHIWLRFYHDQSRYITSYRYLMYLPFGDQLRYTCNESRIIRNLYGRIKNHSGSLTNHYVSSHQMPVM